MGIITCRTGIGWNARAFNCVRTSFRNTSTPIWDRIRATVTRSTPGVRAPALVATRSKACTRNAGSRTRLFLRDWEAAEIALRSSGYPLPPDFAITHYALLYYPAEVLGNDELWAEVRPLIEADFVNRNGRMLAAQWQACLDFDSTTLLHSCTVPIHAIAYSHDVQTPPQRVREVADTAPHGHYHLLEGLGHGSAFGHRPDTVNTCSRSVLDEYLHR